MKQIKKNFLLTLACFLFISLMLTSCNSSKSKYALVPSIKVDTSNMSLLTGSGYEAYYPSNWNAIGTQLITNSNESVVIEFSTRDNVTSNLDTGLDTAEADINKELQDQKLSNFAAKKTKINGLIAGLITANVHIKGKTADFTVAVVIKNSKAYYVNTIVTEDASDEDRQLAKDLIYTLKITE